MDIHHRIEELMRVVRLPLYAVSLTAVPRPDTPLLLMLHWHGFGQESARSPRPQGVPVPGTALQLNDRWSLPELLDEALLEAAWRLGAWDVERVERRGCNTAGATAREAFECRQAFGDFDEGPDGAALLVEEAPDRSDLMQLAARAGYVRWQFRPVSGGLFAATADDATLTADGRRAPPCPVAPRRLRGGRVARTTYRLGRGGALVIPTR